MKILYKSIEKTIREAIYAADCSNRKIEKIELTAMEANELSEFIRSTLYVQSIEHSMRHKIYTSVDSGVEVGNLYGVRLVVA